MPGLRRGAPVAILATVALVVGMGVAVQAAWVMSERLPEPVALLDALESTGAPVVAGSVPATGEFPLPAGSEQQAAPKPLPKPAKDLSVLEGDVVSRDAFTDTFDAGNGLMATSVSPVQRNMLVGEGEKAQWAPIATELVATEDGGFTASPHPLAPVFAPSTGEVVFSLTVEGFPISWRLLDAGASRAELSEDRTSVLYRQVWPGVDLRYTLDGPVVKEEFILAKAPSGDQPAPEFRFEVTSPGLTIVPAEGGSLAFVDTEGVPRAIVPSPLMWDSSGVPEKREAELAPVALRVEPVEAVGREGAEEDAGSGTDAGAGETETGDAGTGESEASEAESDAPAAEAPEAEDAAGDGASGKDGGATLVTVAPDPEWLRSPERVYPVTVDPTQAIFDYSSADSWKSDGTRYWGSLHVGAPTSGTFWRGFAEWNLGSLSGKLVYESTMVIAYGGSGTTNCYAGWVGPIIGSSPSGFYSYNYDAADYVLCGGDAYASYSILDLLDSYLASAVRNGTTSPWLAIRGDETGAYSYKRVDLALVVWWYDKPAVTGVTGPTPTGGAVGPRVPTMQATGTDPLGAGVQYKYEFEVAGPSENGTGSFTNIVYSSPWVPAGPFTIPSNALAAGEHYRYRITIRDAADGHLGNNTKSTATNTAWHFTTNTPPQVKSEGAVPAVTGSLQPTIVTESNPMFSVPYAPRPGDPLTTVKYRFTVATGGDGKSGLIVDSGWLTPTSTNIDDPVTWQPLPGTLRDGVAYTWTVTTDDGVDTANSPAWVGRIKLERRLGPTGPSPYDTAGPATVNLASGNLALAFTSQQVSALGGDIGMVFSYNSQTDRTAVEGLTAQYFTALNPSQSSTTTFDFTGREPLLTRTDAVINASWEKSPAPPVPEDYFMARWTGFVNPPAGGTFTFGAAADDGVRISVGGTQVLNRWSTGGSTSTVWGTAKTLAAGPSSIQVEYFDATGPASVQLWVKGTGIDPVQFPNGIPVPSTGSRERCRCCRAAGRPRAPWAARRASTSRRR